MDVVYYGATMGSRRSVVRRLRSAARGPVAQHDTDLEDELELLWTRDGTSSEPMPIRLTFVWDRLHGGAGCKPIEEVLAMEESGEPLDLTFTRGFAAVGRAQAIIFVIDDLAHNFRREARKLDVLRADLRAARRAEEDVPVVFQIVHPLEIMSEEEAYLEIVSTRSAEPPVRKKMVATPREQVVEALTWPTCAHVDDSFRDDGAVRALDRAIELYQQMMVTRGG